MPADRPVVIYDAGCGFCRRWVRRLKWWDRHDRLALLPLQDPDAPVLAGRSRSELELAAHVVFPTGKVLAGAAALRELCHYLPGGWIPRGILSLPGALSVAEWGYRRVAWHWGPVGARLGRH
jgi:predicted DCC family thiol-disulfide oxidoreductase YuxK